MNAIGVRGSLSGPPCFCARHQLMDEQGGTTVRHLSNQSCRFNHVRLAQSEFGTLSPRVHPKFLDVDLGEHTGSPLSNGKKSD